MNIGIIGAGNVGSTLGAAFKKTGHAVTYGVREPAKAPGSVTIAQAVAASDVLVLATPFGALEQIVAFHGPPSSTRSAA